jgi:hypothetical protein
MVAIAARVIEIIAQQPGGNPGDPGIVQQAAQVFVLIDELQTRGPGLVVVLPRVALENLRKGNRDVVDAIGHQPWQLQISEGLKEGLLMVGQFEFCHFF